MKSSIRTLLRYVSVLSLLFILSFCSKSSSDPTPTQQAALIKPSDAQSVGAALIMPTGTETKTGNPPAASTSTQAPKVTALTTQVSSATGSTNQLSVNYSNLNGGIGGVYAQVQGASSYFNIPLQGTASATGTITIPVGIPANLDNGSFTMVISIYDASGRVSNTVTITITVTNGTTTTPTSDDPYKNGDPYAKDYFISYSENGVAKTVGGYVSAWNFPSPTESVGYNGPPGAPCAIYSPNLLKFNSISGGQNSTLNHFYADNEEPFRMSLERNRTNSNDILEVREYYTSVDKSTSQGLPGSVALIINGAQHSCSYKDSYMRVTVTEVKVVSGTGSNRRGYFRGTFDAILYFTPGNNVLDASATQKRVITQGKFMLPIGTYTATALNAVTTTPTGDRMTLLTAGKWYGVYPADLTGYTKCEIDDYWLFKKDGTLDLVDGGILCAPVNKGDYYINRPWSFKDDQTTIHIDDYKYFSGDPASGGEFQIVELSETTLVLFDGYSNSTLKHTPP